MHSQFFSSVVRNLSIHIGHLKSPISRKYTDKSQNRLNRHVVLGHVIWLFTALINGRRAINSIITSPKKTRWTTKQSERTSPCLCMTPESFTAIMLFHAEVAHASVVRYGKIRAQLQLAINTCPTHLGQDVHSHSNQKSSGLM